MKPLPILRTHSLSLRLSWRLSASPAVSPLPIRSHFDERVMAVLDSLLSPTASASSVDWLCRALDASINTQKIAQDLISDYFYQDSDRELIDAYLDDNTKLLDTCNHLSDKMEIIHGYLKSLEIISHLLQCKSKPNPTSLGRAQIMLDTCVAMERKCEEMNRTGSLLRRLLSGKKLTRGGTNMGELSDILSGSKAMATTMSEILQIALSFKSNQCNKLTVMQPQPLVSWSCSLHELQEQVKEEREKSRSGMLQELQKTMAVVQDLQDVVKGGRQSEVRGVVDELSRSCGKLENGIKVLEERVKELYKHLISFRMALLHILSQA